MSISSSAVLVEFGVSVWTASKIDRGVTSEVTSSKNAVHNAAQVRKNLMAGSSARKKISDYASECRTANVKHTLAWADAGIRLLPTSRFLDYKTEFNKRRDTFNSMVDDFIDNYPALVQVANNYLGDMFDPNDYPDVDEVRSKFGFRLVFSPVPEAGDFRLDVSQQDLVDIRDQYEKDFNNKLADAMREPWDRLHKILNHISDKLTDTDEDGANKRYHESMLSNARDLCGLLVHLNVTKDAELEQARKQLEATLMGADIKTIKKNSHTREVMKRNVDAILEQYKF
jgi:hypothetical protein